MTEISEFSSIFSTISIQHQHTKQGREENINSNLKHTNQTDARLDRLVLFNKTFSNEKSSWQTQIRSPDMAIPVAPTAAQELVKDVYGNQHPSTV
jgi:hypothetical protein